MAESTQRIIDAAADLFARQGIKATSTREIAKKAKISEVTLYRQFPRKEQLIQAVLEQRLRGLNRHRDLIQGFCDQAMTREQSRHRFRELAHHVLADYLRHPLQSRLMLIAALEGYEDVVALKFAPYILHFERMISHCVERGFWRRELDLAAAARMFVGDMAYMMIMEHIYRMPKTDHDTYINTVIEIWLNGVESKTEAATPGESAAGLSSW